MAALTGEVKNQALAGIAQALADNEQAIIQANQSDLSRAEKQEMSVSLVKRLKFDASKLKAAISGIESLIKLDDPVGKTLECTELDTGLELYRISCPIGVLGIVFESRPDALVQISTLALKSGNAVLLKENKPLPDLVMVDGGITQLRAAKAELVLLGLDQLPIVGLAKRYEEIVWDYEHNSGNLFLPRHSAGLTVVTRLRDEAHRFAITYHRELRRQRIKESVLDEIPGIGKSKKDMLLKHFGSITRLARASVEQITEAPGIGKKTAALIRSELDKR